MAAKRRVAITGVGLVRPSATTSRRRGRRSWRARAAASISLFDASGFPVRIASRSRDSTPRRIDDRKLLKFANRSHGFALAAAEQAFADAYSSERGDRGTLGLRRRHRHDGRGLWRARRGPPAQRGRRRARRDASARRRVREQPAGFLPQPGDDRRLAADPPPRYPRLRDVGPHRVRVRRTGDRHRAQADPPRRGRLRPRRRIRFDDQSGRDRRLLSALRAFGG